MIFEAVCTLFKVTIMVFRLIVNLDLNGALKCFICMFCKMGRVIVFFRMGLKIKPHYVDLIAKHQSDEMDLSVSVEVTPIGSFGHPPAGRWPEQAEICLYEEHCSA